MASIQWRPEVNVLTVPQSYKIRFVPRDSAGTDDLAAAMAEENPNYTEDDAKTMLAVLRRVIQKKLLNGSQATIDGMISFGLSFTGRLESPDGRPAAARGRVPACQRPGAPAFSR